jgi:hypothetical protein
VSSARPFAFPTAEADYARLLEITRELRGDFERGEWGRAAVLEAERRGIIERVFDQVPTDAELPMVTATLREIVRLNNELVGLAEHRRRAVQRTLDTVSTGRRADRAYAETSDRNRWRR